MPHASSKSRRSCRPRSGAGAGSGGVWCASSPVRRSEYPNSVARAYEHTRLLSRRARHGECASASDWGPWLCRLRRWFMLARMIRAVLFDCDGVLFDSHRANIEYLNAVLQAAGLPRLDGDGERLATSLAGSQLMEALFGEAPQLAERVRQAARRIDYAPYFAWMDPVEGLYEVLAELQQSYRLGMATNRGTTVVEVVERFGLNRYFEITVGVLDVPRPKPYPDMLEKCLAHLQLSPPQVVYVGDSPGDREAAEAAGVCFVGVGERTGASHRIDGLRGLVKTLASLSQD